LCRAPPAMAAHPTEACFEAEAAAPAAAKWFIEEPIEGQDEVVFKFFDRFNSELEEGNPLCSAILGEFRKQFIARSAIPPSRTECADIVGTGGDGKNTHNVSTPAGLLAGSTGLVKVLKHGNVGSTNRSGSADVLEALGASLEADPAEVVDNCGFAFVFARKTHPVMAKVGPVRKAYGKRCIFNYLGPLMNPFLPTVNVFGVANPKLGPVYAEVARTQMAHARTMVVHSDSGVDKIDPSVPTTVWEVRDGAVKEYVLPPRSTEKCLEGGGDAATNAKAITDVMTPGADAEPLRTFVAVNAAAILVAATDKSWDDAVAEITASIESGKAAATLAAYVDATKASTTKRRKCEE